MKNTPTKFTSLLTAFIFLSIFWCNAEALEIVSGNWDITNNSGAPANDFHMKVDVEEPAVVVLPGPGDFFNDGRFSNRNATHTSGADFNVDWTGAIPNINIGQTIHIGFQFRSSRNEARIRDAYWTFDGKKTPGDQPVLPGMQAGGLFGNLTYTIFNDTDIDITIQDLQFMITDTMVDLGDMIPYTLSGFGPSESTFTLAPGTSMTYSPGIMPPSNFLLAQLTAFPTADPTNISRMIQQHEAIHEPATLLSILSGIAGIRAGKRKQHKYPRVPETA